MNKCVYEGSYGAVLVFVWVAEYIQSRKPARRNNGTENPDRD